MGQDMDWDSFAEWGEKAARWTQNYHQTVKDKPVRAQTEPGDILNALPELLPEQAQPIEDFFHDFEQIVMPGITHWQHPRFFAYFNANTSPPSVLAECLTSAIAAQYVLWQTSIDRAIWVAGLRTRLRNHVNWPVDLHDRLAAEPDFEITTKPMWSLWTFRYAPDGAVDLDELNLRLVNAINDDGRVYLTQTRVDGNLAIRFQAGQFETIEDDVRMAYDVITEIARSLT